MRILNRSFTNREKALIFFLLAVLLGLMYFKFIHLPVQTEVEAQRAMQQEVQFDIDEVNAQLLRLTRMKQEMDAIGEDSTVLAATKMPSYNYKNEETQTINEIFAGSDDFYLGFYDIERSGDQLRRNFVIRFDADNYREAALILRALENCGIRCLLGDVSCQLVSRGMKEEDLSRSIESEPVTVSAVGTFYETVQGGTPDRELPPLPAAQEE